MPKQQIVNSNKSLASNNMDPNQTKEIIGSRNSQRSNVQSNSGQPRMKVNINNQEINDEMENSYMSNSGINGPMN